VKMPRAPRRRQVEVDEARRVANELRRELHDVRVERRRYREALKRIATRIPPDEERDPEAYSRWRIAYDALRDRRKCTC
jgi:CHAD domain-containing protein